MCEDEFLSAKHSSLLMKENINSAVQPLRLLNSAELEVVGKVGVLARFRTAEQQLERTGWAGALLRV